MSVSSSACCPERPTTVRQRIESVGEPGGGRGLRRVRNRPAHPQRRHHTADGAMLRPGALQEGTLVVAMYQQQENGDKVLTRLSLGKSEPAPATPSESPKQSQ